jgi:cytochrome P450
MSDASPGAAGRTERMVDFDPLDTTLAQDLWERSRRLRDGCPVAWSDSHGGFWVINRYDDVLAAGKSWQDYTTTHGAAPVRFENDLFDMVPLETDPPFHREVRALLSPFFTAEAVAGKEPMIRQIVRDLLDPCITGEQVDFTAAFTGILPATVIFQTYFNQDTAQIKGVLEVLHRLFSAPQDARVIVPELLDWCSSLLARARLRGETDTLLGAIAHAERVGEFGLTDKIRTEIVWQLTMAGLDTTTAGLATVTMRLAADPSLRRRLRDAGRGTLDRAISEFLRFEAPVPTGGRTLTRDIEVQGCPMKQGDYVLLNWAAANRDERFFPDPDRLDIERGNAARHLAFGAGVHRCLGRHLASAELRFVIQELSGLSRIDVVTEGVVYRAGFVRAPEPLLVTATR